MDPMVAAGQERARLEYVVFCALPNAIGELPGALGALAIAVDGEPPTTWPVEVTVTRLIEAAQQGGGDVLATAMAAYFLVALDQLQLTVPDVGAAPTAAIERIRAAIETLTPPLRLGPRA